MGFQTRRLIVVLVALAWVSIGLVGTVAAAPTASVTVTTPGTVNIGEAFSFTVTFDNTGTDTGYGPFVDVIIPVNGADGAANTNPPPDGITVTGISYLGSNIANTVTQTFPDTPLGTAPCGPTQTQLEHPYAVDTTNTPLVVCGTPGDQLITVQLPFGSFTPDQPAVDITFNAQLSDLADLGVPLEIRARAGYEFGADPLDNYCCDPTIVTPSSPDSNTWGPSDTVEPTLLSISKTNDAPESETATGPNYPRSYTVTLDVADGQTLNNVTISDYFDSNIVITGISGFSPAGSVVAVGGSGTFSFPYQATAEDDVLNSFEVLFPTVTGPAGASFTVDFYIDRTSGSGGDVVPPATGDDAFAENRVRADASWDPIDPRDPLTPATANGTCPSCPPADTLELASVVIQKGNAIAVNNGGAQLNPGDVLEYTLDVQVSDFFALDDLQIVDVISDGQRITGNPQISFSQHGASTGNAVNPANFEIREYFTGGTPGPAGLPDPDAPGATAGDTVLVVDVSQEIFDELALNEILGGCVPAGGTGGPAPDCVVFNGGQTTLMVTYQTTVQDEFTDQFPSGDASVDHGDVLTNDVVVEAAILDTAALIPTGSVEDDDSSASLVIEQGQLDKALVAVNGSAPAGSPIEVQPGDDITFRLTYDMPSSDFEDFVITDYLPLPVLRADDPNADGTAGGVGEWSFVAGGPQAGFPGAGQIQFAGTDTFYNNCFSVTGSAAACTPAIGVDVLNNVVELDFGNFDDPNNVDTTIDVLLTVRVTTDPFADELFLTNQANASEGSTNAGTSIDADIINFVLRQPILLAKKGITDSTNPGEAFDPPNTDPTGVTMADAGTAGNFSGTISDSNIDSGLDSDAANLDAGDLVRFAVTIQNTGGSAAYDITLYDTLPAGLPASSVQNFQIAQGDGTVLSFTRPDGSPATVADYFNPAVGIRIVDSGVGACQPATVDPAKSVIVITYDLQIDNTVGAGDILTNTVTVTNYANEDDGENFLDDGTGGVQPITDDASIEIAGELVKTINSTSEADSSDVEDGSDTGFNARPVYIGEVVTFDLTFQVPEGTTSDVQLVDNLPAGMQYVANSVSVTVTNATNVTIQNDPPLVTGGGSPGADVTFNLGNIVNNDNDDEIEFAIVSFDAVVSNIASNQSGTTLTNNAELFVNGEATPRRTSEDRSVVIQEPDFTLAKDISPASGLITQGTNDIVDAGDTFAYTFTLENTGNAPAYDVVLSDTVPIAFVSLTSVDVTGTTGTQTYDPGTGAFTYTWAQLNAGESVTVALNVEVLSTVTGLDEWFNTGQLEFTSLPGDNGTGDVTPGAPGDDNGERNGDDGIGGAVDDYLREASTSTLTVAEATITKAIETTADANTTGNNVAIGEVITYLLTITMPEGETPDALIYDEAEPLIAQNEVLTLVSAEVVSIGGNLTNANGINVGDTDTTSANITLVSGSEIQFNFGTIDNAPDNISNADDQIVLRVTARVADDAENVDENLVSNRGRLTYTASDTTTQSINTPNRNVRVQEPVLTIAKNVTAIDNPNAAVSGGSATDADAGDTVTFEATVENTGGAPAYTVTLVDTPPAEYTNCAFVSASLSNTGAITPDSADLFGTGLVLGDSDPLLVGETLTVTYTCELDTTVSAEETYSNSIEIVSFNSQPTTVIDDNRTTTPGTTDTADVTTTGYGLEKSIESTSETSTSDADLPVASPAPNIPVTIGEIVRYQLAVQLPEGTSDNLVITDQLSDGILPIFDDNMTLEFLNDTDFTFTGTNAAAFAGADLAGTPLALHNGTDFTQVGVVDYNSGTNFLQFNLGDIVNNENDANGEFVLVRFNVIVTNTNVNNLGDIIANDFDVLSDDSSATQQNRGTSNVVNLIVAEPVLDITKVATPDAGDANDVITYTITVTNTGTATAFDVGISDPFDAATTGILDFTGITAINLLGGATGSTDSSNPAADSITVTVDEIPVGGSVEIVAEVTLRTTAVPNQTVDNTATAIFTSLPDVYGTTPNPTGSSLSDLDGTTRGGITYNTGSGDDQGERDNSDVGGAGTPDDYEVTGTESVTVDNVAPVKSIIATNVTGTDDGDVPVSAADPDIPLTIGEIVTFQLAVDIPEGTSDNVIKTDVLIPAIDFVSGTTRVYTNSAVNMNFADLGVVPNAAPGALIPEAAAPAGPGQVSFDAATGEVRINLGDITNLDDDPDVETVIVTFDAIVLDSADVTGEAGDNNGNGIIDLGDIYSNEFSVSVDGNTPVTSNPVDMLIAEPDITLTKDNSAIGVVDNGDTVTYTVTAINSGTSVAYDVNITDILPAELLLQNGSVTAVTDGANNGTAIITTGNTSGDAIVVVDLPELAVGETLTVTYDVVVDGTATIGQLIDNTADIIYDTLPDDDGGTDGADRDYSDSTSSTATVDDAIFAEKTIAGTSEAHTSDAEDGSAGNERPVAVGEIITFELALRLIEGTNPTVVLDDTFVDGIEFITGSAQVYGLYDTNISAPDLGGGISLPGSAATAYTLAAGEVVYDGGTRTATFNLGDLVNTDNDAGDEFVVVRFDVLVVNTSVNNIGQIWTNDFSFDVNSAPTTGTNETGTSNSVGVVINEPQATITKTINTTLSNPSGATVFDAGDTVVYDIVVSNPAGTNVSTAFDLNVIDNVDGDLDLTNPITLVGVPATTSVTDNSTYGIAGQVNVVIDQLQPGESFTIRATTTVQATVTQAEVIANIANLTYTSLPGLRGTGDATPGNSGDDDGERNGDDGAAGAVDDYADSSQADFTVDDTITPTKTIAGTSEPSTSDAEDGSAGNERPVAVGEIVTFELVTRLIEGTNGNVVKSDTFVNGIEYLPGTAVVYALSDNAMSAANLGGGIVLGNTPGTGYLLNTTTEAVYDAGTRTLTLNLGDLVNNDSDLDDEFVIVRFDTVVTNTSVNNTGQIWTNEFTVTADGGVNETSNSVGVIVNEPDMSIDKTINASLSNPATTGPFDAGDTVVYDIAIGNANSANASTAFDIEVLDGLDANLSLVSVQVSGQAYMFIDDSGTTLGNGGNVDVIISELRPGDVAIVRVTTTVLATVTQNQIIANQSDATYTSLPGLQGTGDATPGNSGDDDGERNGDDGIGGAVNDYALSDTENFTVDSPLDTTKSIDGTSEANTDDTTADTNADPRPVVVGEVITYRLVTTVGELTEPDMVKTDILSTNIEYVANSTRISYSADNTNGTFSIANAAGALNEIDPTTVFSDTFVNFDGGTRELTFSLGAVTNNDNDADDELVIIEFDALVVDSGTLGDIWANEFSVDTDNDGTDEDTSNQVFAQLAEPVLELDKSRAVTDVVDAGDTISYTLTLTHAATSTADAFNIVVTDTLPADTAFDQVTGGTCAGVTVNDLGASVTFTVPSLTLTDATCTIAYDVTVQDSVDSNTTISNSAVADYDTSSDPVNSRTKTTNTDTVDVDTAEPTIEKGVTRTTVSDTYSTAEGGTDINANSISDLAIGEEVTFALTVTLMEGDDILTIIDTLPAGLTPISGEVIAIGGNITGGNLSVGDTDTSSASITIAGQDVTYDFGAVNNAADNTVNADDQIVVEVTARVDDVAGNTSGTILDNEVDLTYNNSGLDEDTESVEIVEPAPTVTKTFTPDEQVRGGTVTMTLVVSNLATDGANSTLYDVQVTDILDDWLNVTNVTITRNGVATTYGTVATDNSVITAGFATGVTDDIIIDIDALPVDGAVTIEVTMQIDPAADPLSLPRVITNQADLTGDSTPDNDANDRDEAENATDDLNVVKPTLVVTKTDSADPINAGDPLGYTITVENTGTPAFNATNVTFTDELPAGFTVTLVTPSQGTCSPLVGNVLTCSLGTIAQGNNATITINGITSVALNDGDILTNIAYVTSNEGNNGNDGNDTPDDGDDERAEEPTTVGRAVDVAIVKTTDDATPNEGDLINFTLDVTNNGPSDATNVIVTDTIPAGLTFVRFVPNTLPCAYDGGTDTLTCTFPTLAAGDSVAVGIEVTVDAGTSGSTIDNTGSVTTDEPETDPTNNDDTVSVFVDDVDVAVVKTVDNPTPNEGDTVVYSITATNNGPAPATGIAITDDLNAVTGITYVSDNSAALLDDAGNPTSYNSGTGVWSIGELQPGNSLTLEITATVDTGASAEPQPITNTATRTATDQPDNNAANDSDDANIAVGGLDLELQKGVNDATPDEGQSIVYTLQLTNNGGANATNVTVLDQLDTIPVTYVSHTISGSSAGLASYNPVNGEWTVPALNANQTQTLQITVTVDAGTAGTGAITNTASITAVDQTDSDPNNNSDDAVITVNTVDAAVVKTVDNGTPNEGDTIVYSLTVTNNGPGGATGVTVNDLLPAGVTYVSDNSAALLDDTGNPTSYNSGTGVWAVGTLNDGSSLTLEITATVDVGAGALAQPITNTATVSINENDSNAANDSDDANIAVGGLDLSVTKVVDNDTPSEGDTIVYSITLENLGAANATNVTVTDDLSTVTGITYVSDNAATVLDSAGNPTSYNSGTGDWTIGALDANESITLEITATVNAGTAGNSYVNVAVMTAVDQTDSNASNDSDDATITVGGVDIGVTKVVDNSGPASGDNVTYTITVTNNGPATATGVTINENLPLDNVSLTYVSDTPSQGTFTPNNPGPSVWDIGTLTAGQSETLQLTVTVNIATGSIVNTASVATVDQPDSDPNNDSDDATISIGGLDLQVDKVIDDPLAETGDTRVYTITATNNGPNTATGVTVLDILPAGISYVSDNAATLFDDTATPTSFDDTTGNWTIGTLNSGSSLALEITVTININGGQVTNTAEINGNEPDTDPSNNVDDAVVSVDSADLSVTKTVNNNAPQIGDTITYTVTVTNSGPNTAFNVELTDQLPGGVIYVSDTPSQGSFDSGTGVWTVGQLNVGQSANLLIDVEVVDPGLGVTNTVEVTASDQADPDSTPNNGPNNEDDYAESIFIFDPPFGRKTFDANGLPILNWTIEWANPGNAAVTATIVDQIPAGTTFVNGSLTCTTPGSATNILSCAYDVGTDEITVEVVIAPDPGVTPATISQANNRLIINFDVRVPDSVQQVNNEATLTSNTGDIVTTSAVFTRSDEPAPIDTGDPRAAIEIIKYAEPQLAFPGEPLDWVIEVTNPSGVAATGIVVNDDVPPAFNIQTTTADSGVVDVQGQAVTWNIGTVEAGQTLALRISTEVSDDLNASVINTAFVAGDNVDPANAAAMALYTSELPDTGETAIETQALRWLLLIVPLLLIGLSGAWWQRRRTT